MNEMSSSEQLDAMVHNLANLAKQTVQHKAAPRMLCMLMKKDFPHHDLGRGLIPHNQLVGQKAKRKRMGSCSLR